MTAPHKPLVSDELLHRAWRDVRRPGWGDFEASLADPVRGALVRARAAALAHGPPPAPRQQPPPRRWTWPLLHEPARRDAKRAAAGDTDPDTEPHDEAPE